MMKSDQINELATALAKAQGQMEAARESAVNPHFKSTYADLADDWEAARKPLSSNGLSVSQLIDLDDHGPFLVTMLMHTSGQFISGRHPIVAVKNDPQGFKSAVTYARRTALESIIGLSTVEDDDGNKAHASAKSVAKSTLPAPKPAAVVTKPTASGERPRCRLCGQDMGLSKSGEGYYCSNFRDGNGEHSRFKKTELQAYLDEQKFMESTEEVPF